MIFQKEKNQEYFDSLLGSGAHIDGRLTVSKSTQVAGKVQGHIQATGSEPVTVAITEDGEVMGDISATKIIIAGKVTGNLKASESVTLLNTAVINGDISYQFLSMEYGAKVTGILTLEAPLTTISQSS